MKTATFISVPFLVISMTASVTASELSTGSIQVDVQSAIGGQGNVNVSLNDGIATLTGYTEDAIASTAAERAAATYPGVTDVESHIIDN